MCVADWVYDSTANVMCNTLIFLSPPLWASSSDTLSCRASGRVTQHYRLFQDAQKWRKCPPRVDFSTFVPVNLTERQYFLQVFNVLLPLGSFVKCCCMFLWVGLAVFVKLFMYILPPDLWFQSLTVFLCWCFIFFKKENIFLSAACQTYCISKDVKVYFSFWKTIKYHVRKKLLLVSPVICVSSPHFMEESLKLKSDLSLKLSENVFIVCKNGKHIPDF